MSCLSDEILSAAVDGEGGAVAGSHLKRCASCREKAARLRALDAALRALPLASEAPGSSLAATLRGLAASQRGAARPRRRGLARTALGIAAVAAVLAILVVAPVTGSPSRALADDAISNHLRALGSGDGSGCQVESEDPWALSAWLSETLGHDVDVPQLAGATLVGARRCTLLGEDTAAVVYRSGDTAFSIYLPPKGSVAAAACESAKSRCVERAGQTVCVISDPAGAPWLMVGDLPGQELCSVAASG